MSIGHVSPGIVFPGSRARYSVRSSVRRGLSLELVFGGTEATSVMNRANPAKPVTRVGAAPTYRERSVIVKNALNGAGGAGFDTGLAAPAECTMVVVRKPSSQTGQWALLAQASNKLIGFAEFGGQSVFYGNSVAPNAGAPGPTDLSPDKAYLMIGRIPTNGYAAMSMWSTGERVDYVAPSKAEMPGGPLSIAGPSRDSTVGQTCELFYFAMHEGLLTDTEIDSYRASLVAYYASVGVALF